MDNVAEIRAGPALGACWRRQIGRQLPRRRAAGPRHLAAIGYLINVPIYDHLVDVRRLLIVVVHDQLHADRLITRVAGYAAGSLPWGVKFGGRENHRFEKDLLQVPVHGGRGQHLNRDQPKLLDLALQLDRHLTRAARHLFMPRRAIPCWPQLWAALEPETAVGIHGGGPEFEDWRRRYPGADLPSRLVLGMTAFPLELVSEHWKRFNCALADLRTTPKWQVVSSSHLDRTLRGFRGAAQYDLLSSRFR
jgi:hypothetical protein